MSDTNALAVGEDTAPSSDQTENGQPSPVETQNAQEASEEQSEASDAKESESKPKNSPSARIKELLRERNDAEIRAYAAEQRLRSLRRPLQPREGMSEIQRQALEIRNADRESEAEDAAETVEEARQEMRSARFEMFSERVGDEQIVEKFCRLPRVSEELADLVAESDRAKELAAWLANSPAEARRLSGLSPHRLGAEIARKEREFDRSPPVRRVSQAPEPSSTLKGGSNPARKSYSEMSMEEYAAARNAEERQARR